MDQARWLIVLSVVVCMIAVLAFLHRNSRQPEKVAPVSVGSSSSTGSPFVSKYKPPTKSGSSGFQSVKFSRPAPHTFAVDSSASFSAEETEMKDRGRILE